MMVVDTLNMFSPSPPVPQMSIIGPRTSRSGEPHASVPSSTDTIAAIGVGASSRDASRDSRM